MPPSITFLTSIWHNNLIICCEIDQNIFINKLKWFNDFVVTKYRFPRNFFSFFNINVPLHVVYMHYMYHILSDFSLTVWLASRAIPSVEDMTVPHASALLMELGLDHFVDTKDRCSLTDTVYETAGPNGWNNGKSNDFFSILTELIMLNYSSLKLFLFSIDWSGS